MVAKEQEDPAGSQRTHPAQEVGTEGDAKEAAIAEMSKKKIQLKFLVKTLAGWPDEGKGSQTYSSMQREAEEIKAELAADQPTDM
eukprot:15717654-Heterocapsa_arctica.AAC.1